MFYWVRRPTDSGQIVTLQLNVNITYKNATTTKIILKEIFFIGDRNLRISRKIENGNGFLCIKGITELYSSLMSYIVRRNVETFTAIYTLSTVFTGNFCLQRKEEVYRCR